MAYLDDHPPRVRQFRDRGTTVSGVIVLHTAESQADVIGPDTGAEGVAAFIAGRSTYGSYHRLCDSDSIVDLVRLSQAAYGEGTGTNSHSMHISAAIQAAYWPQMPKEWRDATVLNMAKAAVEMSNYVHSVHGVHVPAKRISASAARNRSEGFLAHGDLDPGRRTDPGAEFPWDQFFDNYRELLNPKPEPVKRTRGKDVDKALRLTTRAIQALGDTKAGEGSERAANLQAAEDHLRVGRRRLRDIAILAARD